MNWELTPIVYGLMFRYLAILFRNTFGLGFVDRGRALPLSDFQRLAIPALALRRKHRSLVLPKEGRACFATLPNSTFHSSISLPIGMDCQWV